MLQIKDQDKKKDTDNLTKVKNIVVIISHLIRIVKTILEWLK